MKKTTSGDEAQILLEAQEKAEEVLLTAQHEAEAVLLEARQKAERVLVAAQRQAEEVLSKAEDNVRRGLPELPETERLVRREAAADALREVQRAAADGSELA